MANNDFLQSVLQLQEEIRRTTELSQQSRAQISHIHSSPALNFLKDSNNPNEPAQNFNIDAFNANDKTTTDSGYSATEQEDVQNDSEEITLHSIASMRLEESNFMQSSGSNLDGNLDSSDKGIRGEYYSHPIAKSASMYSMINGPAFAPMPPPSQEPFLNADGEFNFPIFLPDNIMRGYEYQRLRMHVVREVSESYRRKIAALEERNAETEDSFWKLRRKFEEFKTIMEKRLETAEIEAKHAWADLENFQAKAKEQLARLREADASESTLLKDGNLRLERKVEELKLKNSLLQTEITELDEKNKILESAQEEAMIARHKEIADLRGKTVEAEANLEPLKRQVISLEHELAKLAQMKREVEQSHEARDYEILLLKQTLDDWEKAFEELKSHGEREIQKCKQLSHEDTKRLCAKIKDLQDEAADCQARASSAEEELKKVKDQIIDSDMIAKRNSQERISKLQQELEVTYRELRVLRKTSTILESEGTTALCHASDQQAYLSAEVSALKNENQLLNSKLKYHMESFISKEKIMSELQEKLQNEQKHHLNTLNSLKECQKCCRELSDQVLELQIENEDLKKRIEDTAIENQHFRQFQQPTIPDLSRADANHSQSFYLSNEPETTATR